MQTFHAVQDYDQTVYRDPSPSELRLNHFAALAFNAKVLIDFTYNTGASSLFTTPGGDSNPTALLAEKRDIALRARVFGKALVRLMPVADPIAGYTTSIMFIRGKNSAGAVNPIPISFLADAEAPNSYSDWVANRNDPYLRGWAVTNKGTKNNGQPGDVIIAWFKPLDEAFDGTNFSNQVYMMVVNGLSDLSGTSANCLQEIKLNFAFPSNITAVEMLNPVSGAVETNTLPIVSTRRQLVLNLDGGDAALFKFSNGAPFVGFVPAAAAQISLAVDTNAVVTFSGTMGAEYQLEAAASVTQATWIVWTNFNLLAPSASFRDTNIAERQKFYRAIGVR
jgi:hypothetical protein